MNEKDKKIEAVEIDDVNVCPRCSTASIVSFPS